MNSKKLPKINNQILYQKQPSSEIRLIDKNGEMLGIVTLREALKMSTNQGLDLIEISPNAKPPVCKIGDFGKIKYEMQKKLAEERKRNKLNDTKEVKFSINIASHDYNVKINHVKSFIESGTSVKISCLIRGRDRAYGKDRLKPLFDKILENTSETSVLLGKIAIRDNGGDFIITPKK